MLFIKRLFPCLPLVTALACLAGCATTKGYTPADLQNAKAPAFSVKSRPGEMVMDLSPAGGTLRWAGTTGTVLGVGVDAVVNDKYRQAVKKALGDYDTTAVFTERLRERLSQALGDRAKEIPPLGSTVGLNSRREAEKLRYTRVSQEGGTDLLLDVVMTHGLYGSGAVLVTSLEGDLIRVPDGHRLWSDAVFISSAPILADAELGDPRESDLLSTSFDLTVEGGAMDRWLAQDGAQLRASFEAQADAAISALLCALGLAQEPIGEYYLGLREMNLKKPQEAENHFGKALALDPTSADIVNARAVNLAHNGEIDAAIAMAQGLVNAHPDYAPGWYNLAWWLAIEKEEAAAAQPCYEKARALGIPASRRIEKAIEKASASR